MYLVHWHQWVLQYEPDCYCQTNMYYWGVRVETIVRQRSLNWVEFDDPQGFCRPVRICVPSFRRCTDGWGWLVWITAEWPTRTLILHKGTEDSIYCKQFCVTDKNENICAEEKSTQNYKHCCYGNYRCCRFRSCGITISLVTVSAVLPLDNPIPAKLPWSPSLCHPLFWSCLSCYPCRLVAAAVFAR